MNTLPKTEHYPHTFRQSFLQIRDTHKDYIKIYIDGYKSNKGVGVAVICQDNEIKLRLPNNCSIYTT